MKKFVLFSAALIALCACAKIAEEEISSEDLIPDGYRLVSVPVESVDTKAGTGEFTLAKGEKVSVWCTDASNSSNTGFYNFKVKSNGTTVTVQGSIPSTATVGSVALYPASSNHSYSNWHYFFSVDRKKYYVGNSYVPAEIPMYGTKNSSGKFVFTPMVGAVKKQITGIPSSVSKVKVVFTAKNVKVSGTYSVYDGSNYSTWNPVYAETDNEKQFIRYYDVVNGAVTLYIPYAQGTIWGPSNLTVYDYSTESTGATLYTDANVGDLAVTRGQINTQPAASLSGGNNGGGSGNELVYKNYAESSSNYRAACDSIGVYSHSQNITESTDTYGSIGHAKEVTRWAFDNKPGKVSNIITVDNNYFFVVAVTGAHKEGIAPVNEVADQIKNQLDPTNMAVVTNIVKLMNSADDCANNDLYFKAVTQMHKNDPSYRSAYGLYKLNAARGKVADACMYLEEAIDYDESDDAVDAQYLYELARFAYAR